MEIVLHLTQRCNLRCVYCYAAKADRGDMSEQTGRQAIDLALRADPKALLVAFFGGEPLLCLDRLRALADYAERAARAVGATLGFHLSTNGILLTDELLAEFDGRDMQLAISLDGDRCAHDGQRLAADGGGSFDAVNARLDAILRHRPRAAVVSVLTPASAPRLVESARFLWERGVRNFVWQPRLDDPGWDAESFAALGASYRKLADWHYERCQTGERFSFSLFEAYFANHARGPVRPGAVCTLGRRKISVAPDGRLYPCVQFVSDKPDAEAYCIGHVASGFTSRRAELIALAAAPPPACRDCALLGRCRNACGCMNWSATGDPARPSAFLCAHERMLIPIADALGERLWAERNPVFLAQTYGAAAPPAD